MTRSLIIHIIILIGSRHNSTQPKHPHVKPYSCTLFCGRSNLISIGLLGGQGVPKQSCSNLRPPSSSTCSSRTLYLFPLFRSIPDIIHIPHSDIFMQFNCLPLRRGTRTGDKRGRALVKNNLFKSYHTHEKKM